MAPILSEKVPLLLLPRQSSGSTPASCSCPNSMSGGAIAGIVIGSIAGTLLLLWLFRLFSLPGATGDDGNGGSGGGADYVVAAPVDMADAARRRRRRRRPSSSYVEYVEKSGGVGGGGLPRRYREDVRRPARVYLAE